MPTIVTRLHLKLTSPDTKEQLSVEIAEDAVIICDNAGAWLAVIPKSLFRELQKLNPEEPITTTPWPGGMAEEPTIGLD